MISSPVGGPLQSVPEPHCLEDDVLEQSVHELSNLLTIVIGFAQVAMNQVGEDHPAAGSLREVLDASESAGSLARLLQDVGREPSDREPRQRRVSAAAPRAERGTGGPKSPGAGASDPCRSAGSATLHEVSNLLTTIALFSALCLKRLPADDPMRADLREILSASEQAVALAAAWV